MLTHQGPNERAALLAKLSIIRDRVTYWNKKDLGKLENLIGIIGKEIQS